MRTNGFKRVIILGAATLIGIILFQVNWVYNSFSLTETQFTQSIKIALLNIAEDIAKFNNSQLPSRNPVKQVSSNYFVVELNNKIDPLLLGHYLAQEFEHSNIELDYEYSIYDCETDEMVYGKHVSAAEKHKKGIPQSTNFHKFDDFTYYFGIRFPTKTLVVMQKTNAWAISSFILLAAIGFFGFTVIVMNRQKKFSQVQKDFINNMAHEFKTPISTIAISSEVLKSADISKNPERLKKYAEIIENQNNKLKKQIENILSASLIEGNKIKLQIEKIDIKKYINEVVENLTLKLEEKQGSISIETDNQTITINADPFHFSNVIYNLVDNAIKFSVSMPEIIIKVLTEVNQIKIQIIDSGIGIEKRYLKKVFKKFYRISHGDIHDAKGFGLGLNYVKNIVKAHKWKLNLESEPRKGSKFEIIIPT